MEWFTASFPGAASEEMVDGIRIARRGRQWTVHLHAFRHYRGKLRGRFDLVIDQVNTLPFLTPLWARVPVFLMIWQLAKEVWWYESRFPLNAIGYAMEPLYLRAYRRTPVLTFSASTAADLVKLGFRGDITIVPVGIDPANEAPRPKAVPPTFIYVGRLAPSKRVDHIIRAFALFTRAESRGRLLLIGDGSPAYVKSLHELAERLDVVDSVQFCGWLDGGAKNDRMSEATALLMASAREGWGLVVTESNACGTPAVVYDVPGLRDSVRHMQTGLVVSPSPESLAEGMVNLVRDSELYGRLRMAAQQWSQTFTYEAGSRIVRETIVGSTAQIPLPPSGGGSGRGA